MANKRVPKLIKFEVPITVGGKEIEEVTMRVPKGRDLTAVSGILDPIERDFTLVSNLCGLNATVDEMNEFDAAEIVQLQGELKGFLSSTQKTL
ncbi:phage tail assembly protein [Sulfurimonas sp.]|uniref:phage tail assembly protein n=1 Tax=Sulfurimonas sp. TaxID=2022749 RepID=UPI0025F28343|nr:phage tail assembly protein [Sulfurimonas sp.]